MAEPSPVLREKLTQRAQLLFCPSVASLFRVPQRTPGIIDVKVSFGEATRLSCLITGHLFFFLCFCFIFWYSDISTERFSYRCATGSTSRLQSKAGLVYWTRWLTASWLTASVARKENLIKSVVCTASRLIGSFVIRCLVFWLNSTYAVKRYVHICVRSYSSNMTTETPEMNWSDLLVNLSDSHALFYLLACFCFWFRYFLYH